MHPRPFHHQITTIFAFSMCIKPISPHPCISQHDGWKKITPCVLILKNEPISWDYSLVQRLMSPKPRNPEFESLAILLFSMHRIAICLVASGLDFGCISNCLRNCDPTPLSSGRSQFRFAKMQCGSKTCRNNSGILLQFCSFQCSQS